MTVKLKFALELWTREYTVYLGSGILKFPSGVSQLNIKGEILILTQQIVLVKWSSTKNTVSGERFLKNLSIKMSHFPSQSSFQLASIWVISPRIFVTKASFRKRFFNIINLH